MPVLDKVRSASLCLSLEENLSCDEQVSHSLAEQVSRLITPKNLVSGDIKCGYFLMCQSCHIILGCVLGKMVV